MGQLIAFPQKRIVRTAPAAGRARPGRPKGKAGSSAEILLFTGIRYERQPVLPSQRLEKLTRH